MARICQRGEHRAAAPARAKAPAADVALLWLFRIVEFVVAIFSELARDLALDDDALRSALPPAPRDDVATARRREHGCCIPAVDRAPADRGKARRDDEAAAAAAATAAAASGACAEAAPLPELARSAYRRTLERHHPPLLRAFVRRVLALIPSRPTLYARLGFAHDAGSAPKRRAAPVSADPGLRDALARWVAAAAPCVDSLVVFCEHDATMARARAA